MILSGVFLITRSVNFFHDTINLLNFVGCCIVFVGVILYKVVLLMEKEEAKAKEAVAMQKQLSEKDSFCLDKSGEKQPLHLNEEADEVWNEGIEMRRNNPRRAVSG